MTTVWTRETIAADVADELKNEITGKTVLITGVTIGGLGFEAANSIAKYARLLIITGTNAERLQKSEDKIRAEHKDVKIAKVILNLSSFEAVRAAAAEINALGEPIHVVITNAVIGANKEFVLHEAGYDGQFAGDHLGHFLLIKEIFPRVLEARSETFAPRIVVISSAAHAYGFRIDDLTFAGGKEYSLPLGYANAKSANLLFARELAGRAAEKGVLAFAVHPGAIWTNGFDNIPETDKKAMGITKPDGTIDHERLKLKQLNQGATAYIVAAFDPRIKDQSGAYISEDGQVHNEEVAPHASSSENAKKLWEISEKFVGEKFVV